MIKLNKNGYMLVEIIMAFAIAFILVYFIMDLVIGIKNKNDDLLVDTLTRTDQTIITNKLMDYVIDETSELENIVFDCSKLEVMDDNITVKYKDDVIGIMNEYAIIDSENVYCSTEQGKVSIKIPIDVKQVDEDYDVLIDYKYDIGDMVNPWCSLSVSGTVIEATYGDNDGGSGINDNLVQELNVDWVLVENGKSQINITGSGEYLFNVIDKVGNSNLCLLNVINTVNEPYKCGEYACGYVPYIGTCTGTRKECYYHNPIDDECHGGWRDVTYTYECEKWKNVYCPQYCDNFKCSDGYIKINNNYCYKIVDE